MAKRALDVFGALLGLVLLAPLMLGIGLWVKLDSPGPALFGQQRVGRHGALFMIHKFRTMRAGAQGAPITVGVDARITRAGAFLRASKLDELPQLFDVLRGAMSLVGPRPELPQFVALYPPGVRAQVLGVRPGITDPASLAFSNESDLLARAADPEREYVEVLLPAKLRLSAEYAATATLASDLRVLAATLGRVLRRR